MTPLLIPPIYSALHIFSFFNDFHFFFNDFHFFFQWGHFVFFSFSFSSLVFLSRVFLTCFPFFDFPSKDGFAGDRTQVLVFVRHT